MSNKFIVSLPIKEIVHFCRHWQIHELSIFGSALRDDFDARSDVDILVAFSETSEWGLFEHVQMQQELQVFLHRKVDLISKRGLMHSQNQLLREEILKTAQVLFTEREAAYVEG